MDRSEKSRSGFYSVRLSSWIRDPALWNGALVKFHLRWASLEAEWASPACFLRIFSGERDPPTCSHSPLSRIWSRPRVSLSEQCLVRALYAFFCGTLHQWFPTGGTRTPRGTQAHCRGYVETFNNHLCYVILFENHQHGGTHGMTNRLRGYTRQKRLGNTALHDGRFDRACACVFNPNLYCLIK